MGLAYSDVRQLLDARENGVSFDSTLTIGRQSLYLHPREISKLGISSDLATPFGLYADDFLRTVLGVDRLACMDISGYQGATHLHDLNEPVPATLEQRYDVVIDGGSLEHVFNFPVALASLMRMTKAGGRLFLAPPANNLCGHGFYQCSPELMYRVFRPEHGFEVERVALVEARFPSVAMRPRRAIWDVVDPDEIGRRVLRVNRRPSVLLVVARKVTHLADPFSTAPQQSDYAARWPTNGDARRRGWDYRLRHLPAGLRSRLFGYAELLRASTLNRRAYRRAK